MFRLIRSINLEIMNNLNQVSHHSLTIRQNRVSKIKKRIKIKLTPSIIGENKVQIHISVQKVKIKQFTTTKFNSLKTKNKRLQ